MNSNCERKPDADPQSLQKPNDREQIIETVVRAGRSADRGDWTACRDCFTNEVFLDHDGSTHTPSIRKMDEVIGEWRNLFKAYSSSLHFVSTFEVVIEGGKSILRTLPTPCYRSHV